MADRAEDIVRQERYSYFDEAIEPYLSGRCSLESAVAQYRRLAGIAIASTAES